ncbi:hypothetical protein QV65_08705 [Rhodococcus erythropolis]|nr:hypothetical protein QV65_08705 [Rhodococcus erythropolis]
MLAGLRDRTRRGNESGDGVDQRCLSSPVRADEKPEVALHEVKSTPSTALKPSKLTERFRTSRYSDDIPALPPSAGVGSLVAVVLVMTTPPLVRVGRP